jgi:hypothetical protein
MSTSDGSDPLKPVLQTSQIILGALVAGLVFFLGIILFVMPKQGGPPGGGGQTSLPILLIVVFVFAITGLVLSVIAPRIMMTATRRKIAGAIAASSVPGSPDAKGFLEEVEWMPVYMTQMIVGAALIEGSAFFALIVYMLERNPIVLGLALFLIAALALRFPTREKVTTWIDQQNALLQQERESGL